MKLKISAEFDLAKIKDSGQTFRISCDENDVYRFITKDKCLYIKRLSGNEYDLSCERDEWDNVWHDYFDMDRCYADIRMTADDPYMKAAADFGEGIRILKQDPFETLISFIISQRKSIPLIERSVELICQNFGEKIDGGKVFAFPSRKALAEADPELLAKCSLGYRLPYVRQAAERALAGEILDGWEELSDEDLFKSLLRIYGVGIKVANCTELFGFGRTGRAPVDVWIQRVMDTHYGGENPFPPYGENAGIMQQYIFYHARYNKED